MMKNSMKKHGEWDRALSRLASWNLSFAHHYSPVGIVIGIHLLNEKAIICKILNISQTLLLRF